MAGRDRQPGFIHGVPPAVPGQVLFVGVFITFKQLFRVIAPCAEVVFIENHQIPVGQVNPFVIGFDTAGFLVDAHEILERTEADDGLILVGVFVLFIHAGFAVVKRSGNKLPAHKIHMGQQVFLPGCLHRWLEGQNQDARVAQLLCQLVGRKGFAEAHFAVPQEFWNPACAFLFRALIISAGQVHRLLLFRPHLEGVGAPFQVVQLVAYRDDGGLDRADVTFKPLAAHAFDPQRFQRRVYFVVGKIAAVRIEGAVTIDDLVRHFPIGALGGVLLRHALVYIHGGKAYLQAARIGHVRVGVDHGMGFRALWEELDVLHDS